eukprot:TRINITY_DN10298_c0_g2_i1.p1 TRINITY_DN10298_c0_g2~~TRINITY_DN10298_c0_g2_i1.p1  ORF type:complete len:543 (+),score=38.87 TRINITY_DN10298_c0_g2_i1:185-1630(+)
MEGRASDLLLEDTSSGDRSPGEAYSRRRVLCGFAILVFAPMPFCIAPILVPFGGVHPMIHPNIGALLDKEWVYYLWYSPVGWASLYGSMAWWTARCLEIDSGVAPGSLRGFIMGTALPTVLTCALFIAAGLWVFPTPLATMSVGAPSALVWCLCVYLATPKNWLDKPRNCLRLVGTFAYWVLWFAELGLLAFCTYLSLQFEESKLFALGTFLGKMAVDKIASFVIWQFHPAADIEDTDGIDEGLKHYYRHRRAAGVNTVHPLHFLPIWMEYSVVIYQSFVFPVRGNIGAMIALILVDNLCEYRRVWSIKWTSLDLKGELADETTHPRYFCLWRHLAPLSKRPVEMQLEQFFLHEVSECFAPVHFAFIFAFDVFLWNKQDMYHISAVTEAQSWRVLMMLAVAAIMQWTSAAIHIRDLLTGEYLAEVHKKYLWELIESACDQSKWLLVCSTASIATIAGACMIMKHDGMDMSLHFGWMHEKPS